MHLLRVEIPHYRVLENVDITFEKDFKPKIFPLGSENGGGKSTLLQLVFTLLHCSGSAKRFSFLRNMLQHFRKNEDVHLDRVAKFEIWDGEKVVAVEFLSCDDLFLQELVGEDENGEDSLKLSVLSEVQPLEKEVTRLKEEIPELKGKYTIFQRLKEKGDQRSLERFIFEDKILRKYEMREISYASRRELNILSEELELRLATILEEKESELEGLEKRHRRLSVTSTKIQNLLQARNLLYITNYSESDNSPEELALLCRIEGMDFEKTKTFLRKLSQKVFLIAPSTQIYLFLPSQSTKLLFRGEKRAVYMDKYQQSLDKAKSALPGFSTYDYFSIDSIIEFFKTARDRDFEKAVETGEYGSNYKTLLNDINKLLTSKKLSPTPDLSGVTFKLNKGQESVELYPEDLSHGELKRLIIYAWLKAKTIENAIVLMDEIEIALHPDWQYRMVSDLESWASTNQYILATHSFELCQAVTPQHVKELEPPLIKPGLS